MFDHTPRASALLRPRDSDALRAELRGVAAPAGVPVLFGGSVSGDTLHLTEFVGTRTNLLAGLAIPPKSGLGGRVMEQRRPYAVDDYGRSTTITHHFDHPVQSEGLRSILAVPVVVKGSPRAVMYAAARASTPLGDRATDLLVAACRRLGSEIMIRDEVDRRVRILDNLTTPTAESMTTEELRDIHAELRGVAQGVSDSALRDRLRAISRRLAGVVTNAPEKGPSDVPALTPRELDVLAQIALGCTNNEAADRLCLGPETVKSYLRSAMRKLGAHNRHEAVVAARKLGLLP